MWIVVAVIFFIAEIVTPSFFLMWFGVGALSASIASVFLADVVTQGVVFVGISLMLVVLSRPIANRLTKKPPIGAVVDALIGQKARVITEIDSDKNTGRVRVGKEEWAADADERIGEGENVEVVRVEGTHVIVKKIRGDE